ncbi:MAG: hypothetical protein R3E83_17830 [Burkholderiaceae bacterium]
MLILAGALFTLEPVAGQSAVVARDGVAPGIHALRRQYLDPCQPLSDPAYQPGMVHSGRRQCAPIAGVPLGQIEISWFFFSIGMLFWLVLMTIVFYRVLFHAPIDQRLMPTLFILIAPPAVGFLAYVRLVGELDAFGRVLYYSGLFLTLLMLTQAARFIRLGFFLSSWAYSFPLAAITTGSLSMIELTGKAPFTWIGVFLIALLSLVVIMLLVHTTLAIRNDKICVPDQ